MDKITPEDVLQAYRDTGLTPIREGFYVVDRDGSKCACAVGVLIYKKMGHVPTKGPSHAILMMSKEYVDGFISGFDNNKFMPSLYPFFGNYRAGYQNGQEVSAAVQQEFGNIRSRWDIEVIEGSVRWVEQ